MRFFPDTKTFIQIGPVSIAWYAVLILSGAFLAYWISIQNFKKKHYPTIILEDIFFGAILAGVLGARLWYVLFSGDLMGYLSSPMRILAFWEGGLAIHGGLFAGVAYGALYFHKHRWSFWPKADEIVPNILLAQALGRWGNFMNQEAFGGVVDEAFFNGFPTFIKEMMFISGEYRMPTFLFESVLNVVGWVLIHFLLKRSKERKPGDLVFAYLMWYGVVRFFIEYLRTDALFFGGFRIAQLISLSFVVVGLLGYLGVFRKLFFKPQLPTLLFDFDGTLADTEPLILASFQQVFEQYPPKHPLSEEEQSSLLGMPLDTCFQKFLPDQDYKQMSALYREHNHRHYHEITLMDGVLETLEALKAKGYKMGIVSSKIQDMVQKGLEILNIETYFELIVGYEEVQAHKPDPQGILVALTQMKGYRDQALYIGDTLNDIQAACAANVFAVGYSTNPIRKQQLIDSEADRVMDDFNELLTILKENREWTHKSSMMSSS